MTCPHVTRPPILTENEFMSIVYDSAKKRTSSDEISKKYNKDRYNPKDGEIVKAADDLAAFVEAYLAKENGIQSEYFEKAIKYLKKKYSSKSICGINFGQIYEDFNS